VSDDKVVLAEGEPDPATVAALSAYLDEHPGVAAATARDGDGRPLSARVLVDRVRGRASHPLQPGCVVWWKHVLDAVPPNESLAPAVRWDEVAVRLDRRGLSWAVVPGAATAGPAGGPADVVASARALTSWHRGALRGLWLWLRLVLLLGKPGVAAGLGLAGRRPDLVGSWRVRLGALRRRPMRSLRDTCAWVSRRARRRRLIVRFRLGAFVSGSRLTLRIDKTADVAGDLQLELRRGVAATLEIGPYTRIQTGCVLRVWGGEIRLGRACDLRYGVLLNTSRALVFEGRNILGRGAMVHARDAMTWRWGACCAEYVTVLDSDHAVTGAPVHLFDQPVQAAPVEMGAGCFVGAHATVLPGVTVGAFAVVGANSVVSRDVPPATVAVGSPAKPVRDLRPAAAPPARRSGTGRAAGRSRGARP
jgi:acetyltransferase-like isoleucine patch superfamily enzyme